MDGLKYWKFKHLMVSEVTLEIMGQLIERRQKEQKYEETLLKWSLSLFVVIFFSLIYIYFYKLTMIEKAFAGSHTTIDYIFEDKLLLVMGIAMLTCLFQMFVYKNKHKKAENEYEELRITTIDRGEELWEKPVPWNHRHEVYDWMKKEHDINLYYK